MQPLNRVASKPELIHTALDLLADTGYSLCDGLILAGALQARLARSPARRHDEAQPRGKLLI